LSFLFVGGGQRSGTTVLYRLLCADARTNSLLPEASYLRTLVQSYALALQDFEHDTRGFFRDRDDLRSFHSGLVYLFLHRTLAQHPDADVLVLKEPHLTQLFPALHALVPEARFVVSTRDPRDAIASMVAVGDRMRTHGQAHFFQQRDMQQLSNHLKSFYAPVLNTNDDDFRRRVRVVRYEALVRGDDETLQRLRQFTGLALDREPAAETIPANGAEQPRYRPWYTDQSDRALNNASVGRHTEVLTADETAAIEAHCGDLMRALGYE
jgi:hypothetical protein